jgi:hypothetical protein
LVVDHEQHVEAGRGYIPTRRRFGFNGSGFARADGGFMYRCQASVWWVTEIGAINAIELILAACEVSTTKNAAVSCGGRCGRDNRTRSEA